MSPPKPDECPLQSLVRSAVAREGEYVPMSLQQTQALVASRPLPEQELEKVIRVVLGIRVLPPSLEVLDKALRHHYLGDPLT